IISPKGRARRQGGRSEGEQPSRERPPANPGCGMADEKVQTSPVQAAGSPVQGGGAAAVAAETGGDGGLGAELRQLAFWWAGAILVLVCGWLPIGLTVLWLRSSGLPLFYVVPVSLASLA